MNQFNSYVVIKDIGSDRLIQSLTTFVDSYNSLELALYRKKEGFEQWVIQPINGFSFDHFCYLVNFLEYEIHPVSNYAVVGFFPAQMIKEIQDFRKGDWVQIFISEKDEEYDNVSVVTEDHRSYIYDFGGKVTHIPQIEKSFSLRNFSLNDYQHYTDFYSSKTIFEMEVKHKPWWRFW